MSFSLCQYKNIFGAPNTGLHSIRLFNIAIVDVVMTLLGAYFFSLYYKINLTYTILGLFTFGIICHRLFCVRTTVDKFLFS
jgi:hypothetical protein